MQHQFANMVSSHHVGKLMLHMDCGMGLENICGDGNGDEIMGPGWGIIHGNGVGMGKKFMVMYCLTEQYILIDFGLTTGFPALPS